MRGLAKVTPDTRILIVGAGPVGLAASIELGRRGMTPRLIDRDAAPAPESRALAVNPRTLEILEPSGATERMLAQGNRIFRLIVRTPEREMFRFETRYLPTGSTFFSHWRSRKPNAFWRSF